MYETFVQSKDNYTVNGLTFFLQTVSDILFNLLHHDN